MERASLKRGENYINKQAFAQARDVESLLCTDDAVWSFALSCFLMIILAAHFFASLEERKNYINRLLLCEHGTSSLYSVSTMLVRPWLALARFCL